MLSNRFRTAWTTLTALVVLALVIASFSPAAAVTVGNDTINFIAVRYDYPTPGESTWYYQVISGSRPAISHVVWALSACLREGITDAGTWDGTNQNNLTSGDGEPTPVNPDPTTNISGLKFDEGFAEGETRYYYFTLDGNYAADDNIVVASKGGNDFDTGLITGPNGNCTTVANPGLDLEKLVNDADADEAPGISVVEGENVQFKFEVTNTGDVTLTNIVVTDNVFGNICTIVSLAAGASTSCSISAPAELGQHTNLGAASTTYNNQQVQDTDPANYFGEPSFIPDPAIDIVKYINGEDANEAPGPDLIEGSQALFTFVVTNLGNVELHGVAVNDDIFGLICTIGDLAAGASTNCSLDTTAGLGLHTNVATVSGYYGETTVSDDDPANYTGAPRFIPNPGLDLEKLVNGEDADEAPGPEVLEGSTVTFEYIVTNTGNVTLENIVVGDDPLGIICQIASLAPGQTESCTATDTAIVGPYMNLGKARTTYEGSTIHDLDEGHYTGKPNFVPTPGIDIEKYVNDKDADTAPGPNLAVGSVVTFTYVVTNTGNVPLTNIIVADNRFTGAICTIASLAPGASVTCTKTATVIAGAYSNIGKAGTWYGDPKNGGIKVTDLDWGNYYGGTK